MPYAAPKLAKMIRWASTVAASVSAPASQAAPISEGAPEPADILDLDAKPVDDSPSDDDNVW